MFTELFQKKKPSSIEARLSILEQQLQVEKETNRQLQQELTAIHEKSNEHENKQNSPDPWVEVVGEHIDPIRGIEIKLDWNPAFIQYLKDNNITGKTDDIAIQKWLSLLFHNLIADLENKIVDDSDIVTPSEYA